MKKIALLTLIMSTISAFADNENYDGQDVSGQDFNFKSLKDSSWISVNATSAHFAFSDLTNANFTDANLNSASFGCATLTNANFTNATIKNASFDSTVGFIKEQLYSTASYKNKDLEGVKLGGNDLSGWNFEGQNLNSASFGKATLTNADFTNATIKNASFNSTVGFIKEQLYSTASYRNKDLERVSLNNNDLSGWNFEGQNLNSACFYEATLTNANFTNANLNSAWFDKATLTNANFTNATIWNASFNSAVGFTKEQLYSTVSYKNKDLEGVKLSNNNLSGCNFEGQNLNSAWFGEATLTNANFTNANLTSARFIYATLTDTNFTDAVIKNANLQGTGFTKEQLYSTASYKNKDLEGVNLNNNDLSGWNFEGQNLAKANIRQATLINTNFSFSDLRGTDIFYSGSQNYKIKTKTTIMSDGLIKDFSMTSAEDTLVVRKFAVSSSYSYSVKIYSNATVSGGATIILKTGAELEVGLKKTLTIANDGNLIINTDADSSTLFSVESGAGLAFEDGAVLRVNIEGVFSASDVSVLTIMGWEDDSHITGANAFAVDETLFLTVNGEAYEGAWNYRILDNQFQIVFEQIPEPAFWAAVLGLVAFAFVVRRRKQ